MNITNSLIEKYWPLTNVADVRILQEAEGRVTKLIIANQGKYVCKILDNWYTKQDLEGRLKIFDYLKEKNFKNVSTLLKTKENKNFEEIDGRFVVILNYIEGNVPEKTENNFRQLGQIMGTLNNFNDYSHPCLVSVEEIRPTFGDLAKELDPSVREEYLLFADTLPNIDSLPNSLIHFEIRLGNNTIQKPDGTIVFLDWDEAGRGATVLDPGYMLVNGFVSTDLEFDQKNAKVFYESYLATHSLTDLEKKMLFDASLFHALRYVKYDPEKRWKRIKWAVENRKLLESVYL